MPIFGGSDSSYSATPQTSFIFASAGGGGSSKSGVQNKVVTWQLDLLDVGVTMTPLKEISTGDDLPSKVDLDALQTTMVVAFSGEIQLYCLDEAQEWVVKGGRVVADDVGYLNVVRFSHADPGLLATGGDDGHVRVWRVGEAGLTLIKKLVGHSKG